MVPLRKRCGVKLLMLLLIAIASRQDVSALECYTASQEGGAVWLEYRADWKYCVYQQMFYPDGNASRPAFFGANHANMDLASTQAVFAESDALYQVIAHCVLEKYGEAPNSPPEFALRCLCARDGCNKGGDMRQMTNNNVRLNLA